MEAPPWRESLVRHLGDCLGFHNWFLPDVLNSLLSFSCYLSLSFSFLKHTHSNCKYDYHLLSGQHRTISTQHTFEQISYVPMCLYSQFAVLGETMPQRYSETAYLTRRWHKVSLSDRKIRWQWLTLGPHGWPWFFTSPCVLCSVVFLSLSWKKQSLWILVVGRKSKGWKLLARVGLQSWACQHLGMNMFVIVLVPEWEESRQSYSIFSWHQVSRKHGADIWNHYVFVSRPACIESTSKDCSSVKAKRSMSKEWGAE